MRFRITLESVRDQILPWNYQYALQAAFYRCLQEADPGYATFLHEDGYQAHHNRRYKFFVFSDLRPLRKRDQTDIGYVIRRRQRLYLYFSSPLEDRLLTLLVTGFFKKNNKLPIVIPEAAKAEFRIQRIEVLKPEDFSAGSATAILLSPVVVSLLRPDGSTEYLRALDPRVPEQLRKNLQYKYSTLHQRESTDLDITITVDREYVERKGGAESPAVTVLRRFFDRQPDGTYQVIAIKGFRAPIHLEGSPELIQVAYDCGLGEKNSAGFGCWAPKDSVNQRAPGGQRSARRRSLSGKRSE